MNRTKPSSLLRSSSGWTAIEILIVIVIIAILAAAFAIYFPQLHGKIRDVRRIHDLSNLQRVIELYKADTGAYPPAIPPAPGTTNAYVTDNDQLYADLTAEGDVMAPATSNYIPDIAPTYYQVLPLDPAPGPSTDPDCLLLPGVGYNRAYAYITDGINYKLILNCADENGIKFNDPFADNPFRCLGVSCHAWAVSSNTEITQGW